jgi:AFG3 family protein
MISDFRCRIKTPPLALALPLVPNYLSRLTQALLSKEVLNLDAVEELLGERPFSSATLRNIDRYRRGGDAEAEAEAKAASEAAESSGEAGGAEGGEGGGGGDGEGEGGRRRGVEPGMVVAT